MSTLYPGAIDSPTDPSGSETLAAGGHSALHGFANDAIVAIETLLGAHGANVATPSSVTTAVGVETTRAENAEALLAPIASPTFTGPVVLGQTETTGNNTTRAASTAFVQNASGLLIPKSLVTTKGDLIGTSGASTPVRVGVGSDGQVLTADSTQTPGLKWATPAAGGVSSFNARTGPVVPVSGDYTVGEITNAQTELTLAAVQTSNFSCSSNNFYPIDSTSGPITTNLVGAPPDGTIVGFKLVKSATPVNIVTINAAGSDVLNVSGTTTATIKLTSEAQEWVYRAANATWYAKSSTPVGQLDLRYGYSGSVQTLTPSVSGAGTLTQYWIGPLKTYVLALNAWDDVGQTLTFTTAFTLDTPGWMATPGIPSGFTVIPSKTTFILPTTAAAAITGVYVIQGV